MCFLWTLLPAGITTVARKQKKKTRVRLQHIQKIGKEASILFYYIVIRALISNATLIYAPLGLLCVEKLRHQLLHPVVY